MIDRATFFAKVRSAPFDGRLSQKSVDGMNAILDEWERRGLTDLRWLAYILGTVKRECGNNMQPVREGFAQTDASARAFVRGQGYKYAIEVNGQVYYGRGLVQLTWADNYRKMGELLGLDLAGNPDLALRPDIAAKIIFEGMIRGTFTSKKLADYFTSSVTDWINARRIVNGIDHAGEIALSAQRFHDALKSAEDGKPKPIVAPVIKPVSPGLWASITSIFKRAS